MSDLLTSSPQTTEEERDSFMGRFLDYTAGAFNIFAIYIGDRLGLYRALTELGLATSTELASYTQTHERYIREWLEQQAVSGVIAVDDENKGPLERQYRLPGGHVEPLIECSSLNYIVPLAQALVGATRPIPELIHAYQNGGGVPFSAYGSDLRDGQGAINYPAFFHQLPNEWLPSMPDVVERLNADPPAHIADIGCGYGWSSIGMARGYPKVEVDGFDLDEPSVKRAVQNAFLNGVNDRVHFYNQDAGDASLSGKYDLVTAFECVHDMSNPVKVLKTMRRLAGESGTVLIVDERVGETFSTNGSSIDWMMYGWSILHCLPVGMADGNSAGTGTVMRPDLLRQYANAAGFARFEILPVENFFFRFYRLNA